MRKWIVVGVAIVIVLVVAVSAFAGGGGGSGSKPVVITAEVKQRDLQDKVTVTGTLGRVEERTINSAAPSTVSKVYVKDGGTLDVGQAVLSLDGRDAVTENGDVSFFRKLDVGASGADVFQLEQILQASGYSPGAVDQSYTEQTRAALGQWQAAHGYPGGPPQGEQSMTVALQQGTGYKIGKRSSAGVVIGPRAPAKSSAFAGSKRATKVARSGSISVPRRVPSVVCPNSPFISITGTTTVAEGGSAIMTLTSDVAVGSDTDVFLNASGSASPGADYTFPPTVTIPNGATTAQFTVTTNNDAVGEPDEYALISVAQSPSGLYCVGSPNSATVTITDAGAGTLPVVTLTPSNARIAEGMPAQLTLGLDRQLTTSLQVFLAFGGDAVEGADFSRPAGLLIIPPGSTTLPVVIPTLDDNIVEPDHVLSVALASNSSYTIGTPNAADYTIVSEDVPEVQIVGGSTNLGKGGAAGFQIVADQAPLVDTTIQYQAAGTAKPGVDIAPLTGTVLMRAGTTIANLRIFALNTDVFFLPTDMIVANWPTRVTTTLVKEGDIVTAGLPLFSITETGFTVTLKASAADRTKLKVGQNVTVTLQGATTSAPGVITSLDENATIDKDTKTQSYEGKVQVEGDLGAADGAPVTIDVVIEQRLGVLTVPIAAVKQNGAGEDVVRVIDLKSGHIEERKVKTGLSEASYIEIKTGLKGDEVVVVEVDQSAG